MSHNSSLTTSVRVPLPPLEKGKYNRRLGVVAVVATFGGLLFGYDTGVLNGALSYLVEDFGLSTLQEGLITFSLLVGAAIGAFLGGRVSDALGRRKTILLIAVVFFVGALASAFSPGYLPLLTARFLLGLGVGAASVTVPVYLAEVAPFERRGSIVSRNEFMIVIGQLAAFVINAVIGNIWGEQPGVWRYMLVISVLPATALFIGMLTLPESPRWLAMRGRFDEARDALGQIRTPERADAEIEEIRLLQDVQNDEKAGTYRELFAQPWLRRLLFIGIGLAAYQQLTGINSMMYYGTSVLVEAGFEQSAALTFNVLNGVASVTAMGIALTYINRFSRRSLLLVGFLGTTFFHLFVGIVGVAMPAGNPVRPWLLLFGIVAFIAIVQGTLGPLVWLMISEIFPLKQRGLMIGLTVLVLWATNATVSLVFPSLVAALDFSTFFLFAAINALAILFVATSVPETGDRSLEELEEHFRRRYSEA